MERYCPTCNHLKGRSAFRALPSGALARDCMGCEHDRKVRRNLRQAPVLFEGVDIDRIHYKRGAVRKRA